MTQIGRKIEAPWTEDQVKSLETYQSFGRGHPFTGERGPNGEETILIPTKDGWVATPGGPIMQTWAWEFMTDGTWE